MAGSFIPFIFGNWKAFPTRAAGQTGYRGLRLRLRVIQGDPGEVLDSAPGAWALWVWLAGIR